MPNPPSGDRVLTVGAVGRGPGDEILRGPRHRSKGTGSGCPWANQFTLEPRSICPLNSDHTNHDPLTQRSGESVPLSAR